MNIYRRSTLAISFYIITLIALTCILNWWDQDRAEKKAYRYSFLVMNSELDSLANRADSLERVIIAQEQFFDRFLAGHWAYVPALESCRNSFRGYVAFSSKHIPRYQLCYSASQIDSQLKARRSD